ncbi:hypothetical protein EJB05_15587, partial [Eragrostis curvula]
MAGDDEAYDVNQEVDPQEPVKYFQYTALRDYFKRELQAGLNQLQENQEQFAANIATDLQNIGLDTQQLREDIAALATLIQPRDDASVHNDGGNDDSGRQVRQPHGGAPRGRGRGNGHGRGGAAFGARRPLTRARARELQTKVNLFLSTLNYEINENNLLPNGCTLLVLNYEGITSLEEKERVAGSNLCLTAHVHDDGIMREEREAGSSCSSILQWRGRLYFGIQDDHMSIQTCREKIERFEFVSDSVRFIQTDSEEK